MKRKFLIALEAVAFGGDISKGNSVLELEGAITIEVVDALKKEYCDSTSKTLRKLFVPANCMVYAIIPLEA